MQSVGGDIPAYTDTEQYRIIDDTKAQLLALQLKEKQLLEKYPETNKFITDVRSEIEMVKDFLRKQEGEIRKTVRTGKNRNELYQTLATDQVKIEADLSAQGARVAMIEQQLRELDREIRNIDSREKELQALHRRLATSENNYKTYLTKLEEAKISENMDALKIANVNVIHAAAIPAKPIKPRKAFNVGLSIILGGLLAVSLAFFSEYTGQQLATPDAVERQLKLSVLASVKAYKNPISDLNGEMIELHESIESARSSNEPRIIQFVSSVEGEGTTTIVQKFAHTLATRLGKSVLLLNTNYNASGDRPYCEAEPEQKLKALIQQGSELEKLVYPVTDTGIHMGVLSKQTELFPFFSDGRKVDQLWEILRNRFELVLIDSPAVTETPESLAIGRRCDGIVLLVEADKTRWPVVASVRDKITKHHSNLLGVVLNKRRYHIPGWIYRWI
jgi:Mrp family chromosome partitioning ATPase